MQNRQNVLVRARMTARQPHTNRQWHTGSEVATVPIIEVVPTCYMWVSTTWPATDAPPGDEKMTMTFSVLASLLLMPL